MTRYFIYISFFLFACFNISKAQPTDQIEINFQKAYSEINDMLNNKQQPSFKRAVFVVENAYLDDSLDYNMFNALIDYYKSIAIAYKKANHLKDFNYPDSTQQNLSASLFKIFTDSIFDTKHNLVSTPFKYDFEDVFGDDDFTKTFVIKLLLTKSGNCHSLPYLYKIINEESGGTPAYLSFAPHHIYIKQRNKKIGWYNVELTSGQFPIDGYLMATGYISQKNIIEGIYMDTLSYKQSIATCLMDLAYAYMAKLNDKANNEFILKCANTALSVRSNYVQALLRKAEIHKDLFKEYQQQNNQPLADLNYKEMENTYKKLLDYGYSNVPLETFKKWFTTYQQNKSKYENTEIKTGF